VASRKTADPAESLLGFGWKLTLAYTLFSAVAILTFEAGIFIVRHILPRHASLETIRGNLHNFLDIVMGKKAAFVARINDMVRRLSDAKLRFTNPAVLNRARGGPLNLGFTSLAVLPESTRTPGDACRDSWEVSRRL